MSDIYEVTQPHQDGLKLIDKRIEAAVTANKHLIRRLNELKTDVITAWTAAILSWVVTFIVMYQWLVVHVQPPM